MNFFMEEERRRRDAVQRPRVFRDRINPLDFLNDDEVLGRYRMSRNMIFELTDLLREDIEPRTGRSHSIPALHQVMCALRYYGTGNFQKVSGDLLGMSQPSVSRIVHRVSNALCRKAPDVIKFPKTVGQQQPVIAAFYDRYGFPSTVGCVDGSLIPIRGPSQDENIYVCRKGFYAINVQGIADHQHRFTNLVAQWPGSTHDAFIWGNCSLQTEFAEGRIQGHLLGDSGYPLRPWLLTPVARPDNASHERYNRHHRSTRQTIERTFGLWKMRFLCLHRYGGVLMFSPARCVKVITATAVLHNICQDRHVPLPHDAVDRPMPLPIHGEMEENAQPLLVHEDGRRAREEIIRGHFTR